MDDHEIANLIVGAALEYPSILGSQLGGIVKKAFPEFHGLKSFIQRYCSDKIICVGRRGPDFVYAHASRLPLKEPLGNHAPSPMTEQILETATSEDIILGLQTAQTKTPNDASISPYTDVRNKAQLPHANSVWSVFTNPSIHDHLALDRESMELKIIPRGLAIQIPLQEMAKVSPHEHLKIIKDFLQRLAPNDLPHFQQIAETPNPWPEWFWHIRNFESGKYFRKWLDFRAEALRKLFSERLVSLNVAPPAADSITAKFLESKKPRTRQSFQPSGQPATRHPHGLVSSSRASELGELRRLVTTSVLEMSEDELRRVWLPIGAIVNSLRRNDP